MEAVMIYKEVFLYARFMTDAEIATLIKYVGYAVFGYGDEVKLPEKLQDIADVIIEKHNAKELKYKKFCESRSNNRKGKTKDEQTYDNHMKTYEQHMGDKLNLTNTNTKLNKEITPNGVKESKPKKNDYLANCKNRSDEYDAIMLEWLEYKKERKDKLTSIGVCKTYAKLIRLSDGSADKAKAIIEDAIANGYQGFFQLKENKGGAPQRTRPLGEIRGGGWVDTEFSNSWD